MTKRIATFAVLALAVSPLHAADPFQQNVRPTEPLTPPEQAKTFHLPPGFKIELVAGDPDIGKPMNIAFDGKGRLWVTSTTTYPFPSPLDKPGKDAIKIISFNEDGSTKSIVTFADGLNIPVGIMPYKEGCLAFSIPYISYYRDTDGDGKCDKVEPFYGPFDFSRDTHGMSSNYVRGFDGWIYGCHGFANDSTVKGKDGQAIHMFSGHTYRFRTDGSHIEIFTNGQTNPFGMCQDPIGNLYSADSHSKPIYSLLRGGWYESLHPKHDGLGFAPPMMNHLHNSTAIASVIYYAAENFPAAFRDNMFVGNVVTSRINRDSLTYSGSSPRAIEEKDLVTTDDPWFRPIQIKLGPDGALYVSDFYNKIIGHYEVPLSDPRRDYARGRIWKIWYDGPEAHEPLGKMPDLSRVSAKELVGALNHSNLTVRTLATDELVDRVGPDAVAPLTALLEGGVVSAFEGRHALWALHRLGALEKTTLLDKHTESKDAGTRVQCMRILGERPTASLSADNWAQLTAGLKDSDAMVRRSAADAMGRHPSPANVRPLVDLLTSSSPADAHLVHTVRMALRDQLKAPEAFRALEGLKLGDAEVAAMTDLALSVPTADAAGFLVRNIGLIAGRGDTSRALKHAAQHVAPGDFDALAAVIRERFKNDPDLQLDLLNSIREGLTQRAAAPTPALRAWALELATGTLRPSENREVAWTNVQIADAPTSNPWTYENRRCADGVTARLLSSLPRGEQLTGTLRSRPFTLPEKLSFYLCGHTGDPGAGPGNRKNRVRLLTADTHETLAETEPPRNDTAQLVTWQLGPFAGRAAYLEVTDTDTGGAYAWLAFGRLEPAVLPMPPGSPSDSQRRVQEACGIVGTFKLSELAGDMTRLLGGAESTGETKMAAAKALAACGSEEGLPLLAEIVSDPAQSDALREQVAASLSPATATNERARSALVRSFRGAGANLQLRLATHLAATSAGAEALLTAVADGQAPAAVLFDPGVADRVSAANLPESKARLAQLTRGIAPPDEAVRQTIANRVGTWHFMRPDANKGATVFEKNCAVCHQIGGKGTLVGPQLDGIGNRGMERVMEDVLDPNRNVDPAFRYVILRLADGTVLTGLPKSETPESVTLTDSTGKEITAAKKDIAKRGEGRGSLMPGNFADAIPVNDFYDLVGFLMAHKAK